ncbi:MAG: hypothetical protein FIA99_12205 [Ruminiclostridium sp.]|nr:hypothetical protein [Ruminiclostridium sp.]
MMNVQGQYNPMMNVQGQYNPMMNMAQPELESMFPNTYNIIQPQVENMCDNLEAAKGKMHCPSQEEMDHMVDQIYTNVESDVEAAVRQNSNSNERQFLGGGRRILRDLIAILLINSLIRRRRPFFGFPGFFGFPRFYDSSPYGGYTYY